ncbi:class I adenylate-forming enzyme family protein [Ilumatobacter sp.]|uniref:class I adenylate-forming enzyme family protein n=1 Tax=Ilumatobacter sp. TaxID=1967498 RepID=UPI003AF48242
MIDQFNEAWTELTAEGAPFAMSEIEVRGIPMRVFDSAPPTMRSLWELAAGHGDRTYVVFEDERYSYAEIGAQVRALAAVLRDDHGVGSGDRVGVAMRNYPEWVVGYWATVSIGAAVVGLNAWWTTPEMEYGLGDSRPKVLIVDDERLERVLPALPALRSERPLHVISVRSDRTLPDDATRWSDVVRPAAAPDALPDADIDSDDDATIFYTSGTTGSPKGAQLTHRGSVHNVLNLAFMTTVSALAESKAAAASGRPVDAAPDPGAATPPVFMAPTPLFHVTANNCLLQPCTIAGGTIVFTYRWDAARALELIERERVTNFSGVPTMSRELLTHPDWATRDTSSLKGMSGGGAPTQPDLVDKIDKTLTGGAPGTGYGLTETHGIVTANQARLYTEKPASCGRVVPTLDARLESADGDVVEGPDALGELCVRGSIVIKGYLNRPDATAESIVDGWFHTGDIARIDEDGFVFIVDRVKDMVLRGGENVYCSEVEAAIYEHPDVAEAAVFGVPDDRLGEAVAAAIVLREDSTTTEDDLATFLADRIAGFKIPTTMWFRREQLPRNASGKFVKRELRDELVGG